MVSSSSLAPPSAWQNGTRQTQDEHCDRGGPLQPCKPSLLRVPTTRGKDRETLPGAHLHYLHSVSAAAKLTHQEEKAFCPAQ